MLSRFFYLVQMICYVLLPFAITLQCDAQVFVRHVFFGDGDVIHPYFRYKYKSFLRECEINGLAGIEFDKPCLPTL